MPETNRLMENYRVAAIFAIENSQNVEEIKVALNTIGYDEARIQEGTVLHTIFAEAVQAHIAARRDQYSKTLTADSVFDNAYSVYIDLVNLLRASLAGERIIMQELGLFGKRYRNASGFITQSTYFYSILLQKDRLFQRVSKFQITKEMLEANLDLVSEFEKANQIKRDAIGAFQRATEVRDKAYFELRHWMREFERACQIVLKGMPQLCERLGFREIRDITRKRKSTPVPPVPPAAEVLPGVPQALNTTPVDQTGSPAGKKGSRNRKH